jgi:TolA-binding protein
MTTPSDTEIAPPAGFDSHAYWEEHKGKIILYAALFILALFSYGLYQITTQRKIAEVQLAFAQASTEDDYRQVAQKYPHTVAAGNALLLLAEKLRDAKKYDEAVSTLHTMIDQYPDHPLIDGAWISLASTLEAQGKTDEALSTCKEISTKFADRPSAAQALLIQAEILKGKGSTEEAKRILENVKSQFPDSYFANEAMQELQLLKK